MKNITKIIFSIFLVFLLANNAFGFAGMGGNTSNTSIPQETGTVAPINFNNTTESDQDIVMVQHLIEVDAVLMKADNKVFIRETLIFRNIGTQDFFGTLRTWMPDGSEKISVARSEMMTGGGMVPMDFSQDGNIISWKDYVEKNSRLPFLYAIEYSVKQNAEGTELFSKKLAFPTLISYEYMEKPDLPAIVVKITKPEGNSVKFIDENGNKIVASEVDEKGEIFRFSSPEFKEINIEISKSLLPDASSQSYAAYVVIGILIILVILYPSIKKKLKTNTSETKEEAIEITPDEEIEESSDTDVPSGKFESKNVLELEDLKKELLSRIRDIKKEYESGDLLDEEYEDKKRSYQDELKAIEKRLKKMG